MSTPSSTDDAIQPKSWQNGLAPVCIGIFLWIAFFDQIGRRALPLGGLKWSLLGAALACPLCYLFLFRSSALWGHRTGKPLEEIATSTFGIKGASLVPGLLIGIAQVIVFAVAVGYAIELSLQGLALGGFFDPRLLRPSQVGGATLKSPLFLVTALFWAVASALVSLKFTRWIAYLMQFFPIFPAVMLGGSMVMMLVGLKTFHPPGMDPMGSTLAVNSLNPAFAGIDPELGLKACLLTLQWVFAFSAIVGVLNTDWGRGSLTTKDVRLGGWVGMAFAPAIVSALGLIAVAGFQGTKEASGANGLSPLTRSSIEDLGQPGRQGTSGLEAPAYTFRGLMNGGFNAKIGAFMLVTFGLASMAPAVSSSFGFASQFKRLGPGISKLSWTMMGTGTAWLLVIGGWLDRTEVAFNLLGATFAPVAGAIAADYRRHRGQWPGPRNGINPAGLAAWTVGSAIGLTPIVARVLGDDRIAQLQPASVAAFIAAYLTYEILALVRLESKGIVESSTIENP